MTTSPDIQLRAIQSQKFLYEFEPLLANNVERMHWAPISKHVQHVREQFAWIARIQHGKHMEHVSVTVKHFFTSSKPPDPGACFHSYKAGLDGLVDYGILDDDSLTYVRDVFFETPMRAKRTGIEIELFEVME